MIGGVIQGDTPPFPLMLQMNATRTHLLSELNGLRDDQLNWKPNDSTWSIAQNPDFTPKNKNIPLDQLLLDRSRKRTSTSFHYRGNVDNPFNPCRHVR